MTMDIPLDEPRRWRLDWVWPTLFRPGQNFKRIVDSGRSVAFTPLALLILTTLIRLIITGYLKKLAADSGQLSLPPNFEYFTPEQQAAWQQASTATNSWVFLYLLPAVTGILSILGAWLVVGGLVHLIMTLLGGRGSSQQVLNVNAWAMLPFAIRDLVRAAAMLSSNQLLTGLGLTGFAPAGEGNLYLYLAALFGLIDIYLIWYIILLGVGVGYSENLPAGKSWTAISLTMLALFLLRGLPALILAQFSNLTIIRPFF